MAQLDCIKCGKPISPQRVQYFAERGEFPDTCVKCSEVQRYVGVMVFSHKTAGTCVPIDPQNKEALRIALRANRRSR